MLEGVVGLGDGGAGKGVGFNDVGAGFEEGAVNICDNFRPGDTEQVVVALQIPLYVGKRLVAEIGFFQLMLLDHRAHGPVEIDNTLL